MKSNVVVLFLEDSFHFFVDFWLVAEVWSLKSLLDVVCVISYHGFVASCLGCVPLVSLLQQMNILWLEAVIPELV